MSVNLYPLLPSSNPTCYSPPHLSAQPQLSSEAFGYLTQVFKKLDANSELLLGEVYVNTKQCEKMVEYYSKTFEHETRTQRIQAISLAIITALLIALYIYGMVQWCEGGSFSDTIFASFIGVFGGIAIIGMIVWAIPLGEWSLRKNEGERYEKILDQGEKCNRWRRQHDLCSLYQKSNEIAHAKAILSYQVQFTSEKITRLEQAITDIQRALFSLREAPTPPEGPCPELPERC